MKPSSARSHAARTSRSATCVSPVTKVVSTSWQDPARMRSEVRLRVVTGESAPDRIAEARATGHAIAFKPMSPVRLRAILDHLVHSQ